MNVLHLDDDSFDFELTKLRCLAAWPGCKVRHVEDRETFTAALNEEKFDVILSDSGVASLSGFEALQLARERAPGVPFIFLCGVMTAEREKSVHASDADGFVHKDSPDELVSVIERCLKRQ
jgi:DNA-binding NtrC family response regulator